MKLFILAFDHRSSLLEIFPREGISGLKKIIYEGFKLAVGEGGVPKESAAILVDEEFGSEILRDAKSRGLQICLPVEKSGVGIFEFAYDTDWQAHIEKFKPHFVKALVRGLASNESKSHLNLKKLNDYCHAHNYQFILEVLSPHLNQTIDQLQSANIQPDIWKLPGFDTPEEYKKILQKIDKMVILGRGEDQETVESWLKTGSKVEGVVGFAIGRTIFMQPLLGLKNGKISKEGTSEAISQNYQHFYDIVTSR